MYVLPSVLQDHAWLLNPVAVERMVKLSDGSRNPVMENLITIDLPLAELLARVSALPALAGVLGSLVVVPACEVNSFPDELVFHIEEPFVPSAYSAAVSDCRSPLVDGRMEIGVFGEAASPSNVQTARRV